MRIVPCVALTVALVALAASSAAAGPTSRHTQIVLYSHPGSGPSNIAVDPWGNVFVAEQTRNRVVWGRPGGRFVDIGITALGLRPALAGPIGVAVDGSGDLFVTEYQNDRVVELPRIDRTTFAAPITLPFGGDRVDTAEAIAADALGNLFIADTANNRLVQARPGRSRDYASRFVVLLRNLSEPEGVGVDSSGNVFVSDTKASPARVLEIRPDPKSPTGYDRAGKALPFPSLVAPHQLAFDDFDNLYVGDYFHNRFLTLHPTPAGAWREVPRTLPFSGIDRADGIAVDRRGHVFATDLGHGRLLQLRASTR